ncbi:MAG: OmpA family protein [Candidatus Kapaibacterium sp.]
MNTWRLLVLLAVVAVLTGCSGIPIMLETVGGQKEIARGEKATFYWRFQNADYVKVSGDTVRYQAQDQTTVSPTESTNYTFTAFSNGGKDSLSTVWNVRVYELETPKTVQRGSEPENTQTGKVFIPTPSVSTQKSSFYSGYKTINGDAKPSQLKIVRVSYPQEKSQVFTVDVVAMDDNGNSLSGLMADDKHTWSIKTQLTGKEEEFRPEVKEQRWSKNSDIMKMALCVERSATSLDYDETIRKAIGAFPFQMTSVDKLSVITFNQESNVLTPFTTKDQLNYLAEKFGNTPPKGLNSMYKIGYNTLQQFSRQNNVRNTMVMVVSSTDNSSLIYTAEDIIKRARETNTKVYTIAVGEGVENYPLKYISAQTGGRFYYVAQERMSEITEVLREVSFSVHGYYQLQFTASETIMHQCKSMKVVYESELGRTEEKINLPTDDDNVSPMYQALSMFSFRQTIVTDEYKPLVQSLAQVLKDNPDKVIELVGHSSAEGEDDEMRKLALERTQSVRRMLSEMGVNPTQVRARALGDLKPLYYFQQAEWQKDYNRRVELRWLDASVQPFEIVAEYVYAETEAIKYTEQWEKRGYKAYYERVYMNSNSGYRVKLWGYATEDAANSEAKTIEKKYATKVSVE